jgi:hypothetical protein
MTVDSVATWTSLVDELELAPCGLQLTGRFVERLQVTANFTEAADFARTAGIGRGDLDGIFMDIQTDVRAILSHGLSPW